MNNLHIEEINECDIDNINEYTQINFERPNLVNILSDGEIFRLGKKDMENVEELSKKLKLSHLSSISFAIDFLKKELEGNPMCPVIFCKSEI